MTVRSRPGPAGRRDHTRITRGFPAHTCRRGRGPRPPRPRAEPMSASRRPRRLRIDTFEDRVVPTLGVGINVDSFGLTGAAPDGNSLAAGPNNVVQFLAGDVEVFDKAGNFLRSEADTDFWTAAGISSSLFSVGLSEPRVVYDSLSQRWFATEISLAVNNNEIFVARSDTSDPTGHWSAVHYTGAAGLLTGFPTLGV